uniref:Glutamate--cysteine ligase n=1 Tax=Palpitomonas bilix TaxID=652834 RepID=A0A7S3GJD9_9EUKA|mmetsp:Transcript_5969/g.14338  ORF Transcript_5969/g.14338 Transcript_5969/m.14338 type:complete len:700 (+) Transcript_5969:87-2186(+)
MGLLVQGTPLAWSDSRQYVEHVKQHGVSQLLHVIDQTGGRLKSCLKAGDETEYTLVFFDEKEKKAYLSLSAPDILDTLMKDEKDGVPDLQVLWRPEYANWMIEAVPGKPYSCFAQELLLVERNMTTRRETLKAHLQDGERLVLLSHFPRTGCERFTYPIHSPGGPIARSVFTPDESINPHPRFGTLTKNIRTRRGRKVDIKIPLFRDERTPATIPVPTLADIGARAEDTPEDPVGCLPPQVDYIHCDSMAFGMGSSCLQITLETTHMCECRHLYDQLAVMAPIMMSLSAASPIVRGYLADTDLRWNIIANSVDCRDKVERGEVQWTPQYAGPGKFEIRKPRYSGIDLYISKKEEQLDVYNDVETEVNEEVFRTIENAGVDSRLAKHFGHLFVRDPMVIYKETLYLDDTKETDHFENIQSTNWNSVRFKPPPADSNIGWRVEFRTLEMQPTDFENAALVVFTVLLARVIIAFDLHLYIPISKVDENMERAHVKNSYTDGKFFFRKSISRRGEGKEGEDEYYGEYSIDQILHGDNDGGVEGIIPLMKKYLDAIHCEESTRHSLERYIDFIGARATGAVLTPAAYMREYVMQHPKYERDSVVSEEINYDLCKHLADISDGFVKPARLLGDIELSAEREREVHREEREKQEKMGKKSALARLKVKKDVCADKKGDAHGEKEAEDEIECCDGDCGETPDPLFLS